MKSQTIDLPGLLREAGAVADDTQAAFSNLTVEQLNWKPGADRWSIAQCFDHLLTTNKSYFPTLEDILAGKKATTMWERMPVLPSIWAKLLIKSLDPATTRKLKAPKRFAPTQSDLPGSIIADFVHNQSEVVRYMKATEGFDLDKLIITSPAAGAITYSLMDAYRIIVVHEKRHFLQAKRVSEENEFPRVRR